MKDEQLRAFFSYSRADSEFALRLAKDLRAVGATVWLDQLDIHAGERWDRSVEAALTKCPRMIVILSPASVSSTNVMDEVSFALEEQKTVIPVLYQDCKIPFRLRRLQYMDCRSDYAGALKSLLSLLEEDETSATAARSDSSNETPGSLSAAAAQKPDIDPPRFAPVETPMQGSPDPGPKTPTPTEAASTEHVVAEAQPGDGGKPPEIASRPLDFSGMAVRPQPDGPSAIQRAGTAYSFGLDSQSAIVAERRQLLANEGNPKTRRYVAIGAAGALAVVLLIAIWPRDVAPVTPHGNGKQAGASPVSPDGGLPGKSETEKKEAPSAANQPRPAQRQAADAATKQPQNSKTGSTEAQPEPDPPKQKPPMDEPASAPLEPPTPARIHVGGDVQQAKIVTQVQPVYPTVAKQTRVQGVVKLSVIIAADGTVQEVNAIGGHPFLVPAAIDAVKKWVYKPTLLSGKPVEVETTIELPFVLGH
jgi:TonB family protein